VSDADARQLADGFTGFEGKDLTTLSTGEAIARIGRADHDFNLRVPLAEPVDAGEAAARQARAVAHSRAAYGSVPASAISVAEPAPLLPGPHTREVEEPQAAVPFGPTPGRITMPPRTPQKPPEPRPPAPLGRGGAHHKYLQELVKRFAESRGFRATIEQPMLDGGGSVDVALENDTRRIACEISVTSTPEYELRSALKCISAGFHEVVMIASDAAGVKRLQAYLRTNAAPDILPRIRCSTAEEFLTALANETPNPETERVAGYKVKVAYGGAHTEEAASRNRAVSEVLAKSLRRLDPK
jgi:hypothetical protein